MPCQVDRESIPSICGERATSWVSWAPRSTRNGDRGFGAKAFACLHDSAAGSQMEFWDVNVFSVLGRTRHPRHEHFHREFGCPVSLALFLAFFQMSWCLDPHFPHQKARCTAFQGMGNAGTSVEFATAWVDITWMIALDAAQALLRRKDNARPVLQTNVESHVSLMQQQVFETWVCWTAACLVMTRVEENHRGCHSLTRPRLWTWYLPWWPLGPAPVECFQLNSTIDERRWLLPL